MSGGMLPFIGPNGFPQWAHLSEFLSTSHFLSVPGYTQACPDCRGKKVPDKQRSQLAHWRPFRPGLIRAINRMNLPHGTGKGCQRRGDVRHTTRFGVLGKIHGVSRIGMYIWHEYVTGKSLSLSQTEHRAKLP